MSLNLRCGRGHTVPFTDDDRGGEVYCPVCGVVCPVPEAEAAPEASATGLRCKNGHEVSFTDDDRGGEVYCRKCGVACAVPESAPVEPVRRRASVFSSAGEAQVAARIAGRVPCPRCEQPVSYTVAEFGETVYCTKCGASVAVGESLKQAAEARAEPAPTGTTPVRAPRKPRTILLAASVGFFALIGGGVFATWQFPESMPFDATVLPWNKALVSGSGSAEGTSTLPPTPPPPPPPPPPPQPDKKIKMEMIERLSGRADVKEALVDAQSWRDVLIAYKVPKTDPRLVALLKVIPELQLRLKEQWEQTRVAKKPSPAEECFDLLDAMLAAIRAKDVAAGRKAATAIEALMKAHPDLQKRFADRYEAQKSLLEDLSRKPPPPLATKTVADVDLLVKEAFEAARDGKVTEAMEARARAMFLAPRVKIDGADEKRLNEQIKDLSLAIQKARGLRSAKDAETCHKEGDTAAFKVLLIETRRDMPRFTSEPSHRKAYDATEALAKKPPTKNAATDFGKTVQFRHEYEAALDAFRDRDKLVLAVEAAQRAHAAAPDAASKQRVVDYSYQGVEDWIQTTGDGDGDADRREATTTALDRIKPWIGADQWKRLSAQVRPKTP